MEKDTPVFRGSTEGADRVDPYVISRRRGQGFEDSFEAAQLMFNLLPGEAYALFSVSHYRSGACGPKDVAHRMRCFVAAPDRARWLENIRRAQL